jgi:regulator of vacuolar morphogenesis
MSVWIWGLLSKCHSLEEMSTEEVGEIRAFAKRAVKILSKIREAEKREQAEKQQEEAGSVDGSDTGENDEQGNVASLISNVDHATEQDAPDVEMSMSGHADQPDDLAAGKEPLQTRMQDNMLTEEAEVEDSVKQQIRVLLDMMITIAGEFFGQRDLLAAREVWGGAHTA